MSFRCWSIHKLSKEHISQKEHSDMEEYFNSKMKLFEMCQMGFINIDDFRGARVKREAKCQVKTYGIDNTCDLLAKDITITNIGVDFKAKLTDKKRKNQSRYTRKIQCI